jgi:hypothetical protein
VFEGYEWVWEGHGSSAVQMAPQGLKPASVLAQDGTAEAVPFPKLFVRQLLRTESLYFLLSTQDSSRMPNVHYVPILHDVVLTFQPQSTFGAGIGFGAGFQKLIPADGFGADKMLF